MDRSQLPANNAPRSTGARLQHSRKYLLHGSDPGRRQTVPVGSIGVCNRFVASGRGFGPHPVGKWRTPAALAPCSRPRHGSNELNTASRRRSRALADSPLQHHYVVKREGERKRRAARARPFPAIWERIPFPARSFGGERSCGTTHDAWCASEAADFRKNSDDCVKKNYPFSKNKRGLEQLQPNWDNLTSYLSADTSGHVRFEPLFVLAHSRVPSNCSDTCISLTGMERKREKKDRD